MDTNTSNSTQGGGHQHRAELLAQWLATEANNHSVVGSVRTDGYVMEAGWMFRKQAE